MAEACKKGTRDKRPGSAQIQVRLLRLRNASPQARPGMIGSATVVVRVRILFTTLASGFTLDGNESGELQGSAMESRRGATAEPAIACIDQAIRKIGRRILPRIDRVLNPL
jgi:hypothetical protein